MIRIRNTEILWGIVMTGWTLFSCLVKMYKNDSLCVSLSRRPGELSAPQHVDVDVVDGLAALHPIVDHDPGQWTSGQSSQCRFII